MHRVGTEDQAIKLTAKYTRTVLGRELGRSKVTDIYWYMYTYVYARTVLVQYNNVLDLKQLVSNSFSGFFICKPAKYM